MLRRVNGGAQQDKERIRVLGVPNGELLEPAELLLEKRRSEIAAIGEVAVKGRLPYPGPTRDLAHRDIGALCEQLPGQPRGSPRGCAAHPCAVEARSWLPYGPF